MAAAHIIILLILSCCVIARAQPVTVQLAEGTISGHVSYSNISSLRHVPLATFLGVPYGESTSGDGRWSPPRPKGSWSEARDANKFAAACPGGTMTGNLSDPHVYSEDCLFANIWTPAAALAARKATLPVVVWIHGGGFFVGTANDPVWWGHQWAARGCVFISFEYRIGALGFFHSSAERNATNFGLLDQILLLQWVKRNAAAFGGSSSQVTLMGQSAGAMSVLLLMTMPAARDPVPLFSRAIACSPVGLHYRTTQEALQSMETFAHSLACSESDLDCLRRKPFHEIVSLQLIDYVHLLEGGYDNFLPWLPLIAPELQGGLHANPLEAFRSGQFHRIPVIIGSVKNETDAWIPKSLNATVEVEAVTRAFFGSNSSAILEQYQESPPFARFGTLLTDSLVTCYVRHVARLISSANNASVRLYTNMHAPSLQADPTNWKHFECSHGSLCHAGDNVFTFASYSGIEGVSFTQFEQLLSDHIVDTLVSFTTQSLPSWWPIYSTDTDASLQWGINGQLASSTTGYHSHSCDFWDRLGYQQ